MENVKEIKITSINTRKLYRNLSNRTNRAYLLCKMNSCAFTIGRFVQRIKFRDEDSINKMYYDFSRANLINKTFLLFIKQNLLTCKNRKSFDEISEMLLTYRINSNDIMENYWEKFLNLLNKNEYSSIETGQELKKVLTNNKYSRSIIN